MLDRRIRGLEGYRPWLTAVLDELGIARACLIGNSIGGWMGISFAVGLPDRIERLALISPASLVRFGWGLFKTLPEVLATRSPEAKTRWLRHYVRPETLATEPGRAWAEQVGFGLAGFKPVRSATPMIGRHGDEILRRIPVPVLLIEGVHEPLYDPRASLERGKRLIPNVTAHLLDSVGHVGQMEDPDRVNPLLLDFVA